MANSGMTKVIKKNGLICLMVIIYKLAFVVLTTAVPHEVYAAIFTVNNTEDTSDMTPGDGVCSTAAGTCTLRAAIQESNALGGLAMNQINLATTGVYKLDLGALEILDSLVINGDGAESTVIDGQLHSRVFSIGAVGKSPVVEIIGVTIRNGKSTFGVGGGILIPKGSRLFLIRSIVDSNRADVSGAGIFNEGTLDIAESTITHNEGPDTGGGGIKNNGGTVTMSKSTVDNNSATGGGFTGGGGIENIGGSLNITNSTISGNKLTGGVSPRGGGIRNAQGATLNLTNVTIANNSLPPPSPNEARQGGGISNENSTVNLTNTLIAGNSAQTGPDCFGTLSSGDFNLISNATDCNIPGANNIINHSAQLNQLAANGGPTWTHALSSPSPAIDKGSFSDCPAMDQRGAHRPVHGRCDIGAFERAGYYVGKQGSDANTCTQAQSFYTPKLTISSGASCLKPGETLFVQAGVYAEQLSNVIPSGTSSAPVTVTAFPRHVVTIRPDPGVSTVLTFGQGQAYIVIDRMKFDCINASNNCVSIQGGAHHIELTNSELKNSPGGGVLAGSNSTIASSIIHDNVGDGIEVNYNSTDTRLYNNTIHNNQGYGIAVGNSNVSGTVIRNNIISSNVKGAINNLGTGTIVQNNITQ